MSDKHYIVIGGTSGIGKALTQKLTEQGNQVQVYARHIPATEEQINGATYHHADFSVALPFPLVPAVPIAGLAYCPGSIQLKPFRSLQENDFLADININLMGAIRAIKNFLPSLRQNGKSSILLFSTVAVQTGMMYHTSVAAAKGAVEGFTRSLAAELTPDITVNAIAPSLTATNLSAGIINTESKLNAAINRHPLARIGNASEIAAMAALLLNPEGSWITGQVITIDGGLSVLK